MVYATVFSLATMLLPSTQNHGQYTGYRVGVAMSAATSMAVFDHALQLPVGSTLKSSSGASHGCSGFVRGLVSAFFSFFSRKNVHRIGSIASLISSDSRRFIDFGLYCNHAGSSPLEVVVAIAFIFNEIGSAAFAGLAVILATIPLQAGLGRVTSRVQRVSSR